jgi:hypothetical protein
MRRKLRRANIPFHVLFRAPRVYFGAQRRLAVRQQPRT